MKKILILIITFLMASSSYAIELPDNISEYTTRPYLGMSFDDAVKSELPFLLVIASSANLPSVVRFAPVGEMVYKEFKDSYNFCIINAKIEENENLIQFFKPKSLPAVYLIDGKKGKYCLVHKKYYNKTHMRKFLNLYLEGKVF